MMRLILAVAACAALPTAVQATTNLGAMPAQDIEYGATSNVQFMAMLTGFQIGSGRPNLLRRTSDPGFTSGIGSSPGSNINDGPLNGVPEPAAWAMLIAGFGLVGAAARRRRPGLAA